ncbi:unnamed protein product [Closterium sp. NIES-54]
MSPCRGHPLHCFGWGRLAMRRCSGYGALVPLSSILPRTSCPPALFPASSLAFPLTRLAGSSYHPTSRRVLPSQDVTFDESVPFYHLFPYRTAPLPPPAALPCSRSPPVDPLPPQGPAPLGVSQVDPLPGTVPVEVAADPGAAGGAASGGAGSGGAEPASAECEGADPEGAEPGGAESEGAESGDAELGGAEPGCAEPRGTEPEGAEPGGAESEGAESGGAEPRGTVSVGGPVGTSPQLSPRQEPLLPQQLPGGGGATSLGGAGVTAGAGGTGCAGAAGPEGASTRGTGAGGAGAGGAGAGDPGTEGAGAGGTVLCVH